jgi:hypothetical protein
MRSIPFLGLVVTLSGAGMVMARFAGPALTYQQMFDKADLVVIAIAYKTKDTNERNKLLDTVDVIGVETEFNTELTLKGPKDVRIFLLHHYREPDDQFTSDGPALVYIPPEKHPTFLLFLVKEKDGRYAPLTGQTDPKLFSVIELKSGVHTLEEQMGR